jgi:hypothetical protein
MQYSETKKLPSIKIDVEDFFASRTNTNVVERIQAKTEYAGITKKTYVPVGSDALVNKLSPSSNVSVLLKNGEVIERCKLSYEDPQFKAFCVDLIENRGKLVTSKSKNDLVLIENVIKSTLINKLTE